MKLGCLTILANHLDNQPTFSLVRPILDADIAPLDHALSTASVICTAFEDRLKGLALRVSLLRYLSARDTLALLST